MASLRHPSTHRLSREDIPALLLLGGVIALFFWKLVFTNLILARGDTFFYIYPYWTAAADGLRAGHLPLWNPLLFMGAPFLANSQAGLLYPFNWPLWLTVDIPRAASLSIFFHLWLAASLTYSFARDGLQLGRAPAWLAAAGYALGGYLTAHAEQINQLQGLCWLPAVFWLLTRASRADTGWAHWLALTRWLALVLGIQLLVGHTQAVFLTLVGGGIFATWLTLTNLPRYGASKDHGQEDPRPGRLATALALARSPLGILIFAGVAAGLLAAVQLLPTLELSQHSVREGSGLPFNEAVSFSLHPLLLGQSLLPTYGTTTYSEYVAFVPLTLIFLGILALLAPHRSSKAVGLAVVSGTGLFFALGAANPLYGLLVRVVPGFALFRAPARWLALYSFGLASLAGIGLNGLEEAKSRTLRRAFSWGLLVAVALIIWCLFAPTLTTRIPAPPEAPVTPPTIRSLVGWLAELAALFIVVATATRPLLRRHRLSDLMLILPSLIVLWGASRALPYNHPTTPDAYHALRPATAFLKAESAQSNPSPPGRFLSMSDIYFDPGDLGELQSIYGDQLDESSFYDLIIATKQKEILAPNLPLTFGIPAVDGYDGGVLPLANYVTLERLLLPPESISMDGRLRENLASLPPGKWLNLLNVRYLITDKVGDTWADGVFYDLQHGAVLNSTDPPVSVASLPSFEATAVGVLVQLPTGGDHPTDQPLAIAEAEFTDGRRQNLQLLMDPDEPPIRVHRDGTALYLGHVRWEQPGTLSALSFSPLNGSFTLELCGLSLIDERDDAFASLVISDSGRYRLLHSGDVKIYENLDVLPRAFLVSDARWAPDDSTTLDLMMAPGFDPVRQVALTGRGDQERPASASEQGRATIVNYLPERIRLQVSSPAQAWLVLTDAFYPGWRANVDGEPVPIERADIMFRAIKVPAGEHEVEFSYHSTVRTGLIATGLTLALWLATCLIRSKT